MFIQTEQTPNPLTLKFLPGRVVMKEGTAFYQNINEASNSPFAKRMFDLDGVDGVFFGSDFITITKVKDLDWQVLKPLVLSSIMDHYKAGDKTIISNNEKNENYFDISSHLNSREINRNDEGKFTGKYIEWNEKGEITSEYMCEDGKCTSIKG